MVALLLGQCAFITLVSRPLDKILTLCPAWHFLNLRVGFPFEMTAVGATLRIFLLLSRPCCYPVVLLSRHYQLFDWYGQWQYQSFRIIDRFSSNRFRGLVCSHWTVKVSVWITSGGTDTERSVQWDVWWRSNRKSWIHWVIKHKLRNGGWARAPLVSFCSDKNGNLCLVKVPDLDSFPQQKSSFFFKRLIVILLHLNHA